MSETEKPQMKLGVKKGGGVPPTTFKWSVAILDVAHREASELLTDVQYRHLAMQVKELAKQIEPTHSETVDVKKIEDYYEISDRGGVLGDINVRVFFGVHGQEPWIIVLGVIKKQNNGKTPMGDKIRMTRRWRKFKAGEYGQLPL